MTNEELLAIMDQERAEEAKFAHRIHICTGTGCVSSRSDDILAGFEAEIKARGLEATVMAKKVGCMGLCAAGPIVSIQPDNLLYKEMTPELVPAVMDSLGGDPIKDQLIDTNIPFFYRQEKNALENAGVVNPERIEDYIAAGGYSAMVKALSEMSPAEVIQEVLNSGLRGRGGAGFKTGLKWSMVAKAAGDEKYIICNADEGDPGAFMDRSVLESDPHRVLEGMVIAAYAVGATQGYLYVRAEYPLAIKRLKIAIRQAEKMGLLGQNICNTPLNFKIDIRLGAGAFVCGEETALMSSVEGNRGTPNPRPPFPAQSGLRQCPTLINNVETFANIAGIINDGGKWFARIGTETSKGTKVFAITGKINNTGMIEVPMGISLREIIYDIGGGIPNGRKFKAVQTGGPSGGCIPEELLDTTVDYESLRALGSMMGSGGMIVIDDTSNMIDMARYFMEFSMEECCGKCIPCRVGTTMLYNLLGKFQAGEATEWDLKRLEELCDMVKNTSLCGLGQAAPNPI
ncbi:MAG: NAD(P)H-dependent oxidoreductase subunit E, partial [Gammaproteobacteria bacterium]|nr:NAD(P)H-dependent oxidoreductase subunit E [Gammaproteobacteria bacterium]